MHNTIATIFKIIIITIILGTLYTLSIMVIDLFATTQRIQEVGDYLSRDIATHNCLLYQPYKYAADELVEISNNSEYLRACINKYCPQGVAGTQDAAANDTWTKDADNNIKTTNRRGITLTTYTCAEADKATTKDQRYIQMSETATSLVAPASTAGDSMRSAVGNQLQATGAKYCVAQYGDVLVLRINAFFEPKMLARMGSNDGNITVADIQWGVWNRVPVSFTYQIPCLSYIK